MQRVINGRPDFADRSFGITRAKRFAPYVYSRGPNAALVHRVADVELHWYMPGPAGHTLVRRDTPKAIAHTVCGMALFLRVDSIRPNRKSRARLCVVPAPGAVLCGRCHGEVATFGKDGAGTKAGLTRKAAGARLGCVVEGTTT